MLERIVRTDEARLRQAGWHDRSDGVLFSAGGNRSSHII